MNFICIMFLFVFSLSFDITNIGLKQIEDYVACAVLKCMLDTAVFRSEFSH